MDTSVTNSTTHSINGKAIADKREHELDDVAELLRQLSSADSMAKGMEFKIDSVLQDLDKLLALLGAEETPTASEESSASQGTSGSIVD